MARYHFNQKEINKLVDIGYGVKTIDLTDLIGFEVFMKYYNNHEFVAVIYKTKLGCCDKDPYVWCCKYIDLDNKSVIISYIERKHGRGVVKKNFTNRKSIIKFLQVRSEEYFYKLEVEKQ